MKRTNTRATRARNRRILWLIASLVPVWGVLSGLAFTSDKPWLGVAAMVLGLIACSTLLIVVTRRGVRALVAIRRWFERRITGEVTDLREPGEAFCSDCPDHEACMTNYPCSLVKRAGGVA